MTILRSGVDATEFFLRESADMDDQEYDKAFQELHLLVTRPALTPSNLTQVLVHGFLDVKQDIGMLHPKAGYYPFHTAPRWHLNQLVLILATSFDPKNDSGVVASTKIKLCGEVRAEPLAHDECMDVVEGTRQELLKAAAYIRPLSTPVVPSKPKPGGLVDAFYESYKLIGATTAVLLGLRQIEHDLTNLSGLLGLEVLDKVSVKN